MKNSVYKLHNEIHLKIILWTVTKLPYGDLQSTICNWNKIKQLYTVNPPFHQAAYIISHYTMEYYTCFMF